MKMKMKLKLKLKRKTMKRVMKGGRYSNPGGLPSTGDPAGGTYADSMKWDDSKI